MRLDGARLVRGGVSVRRAERPFELLGERRDGEDVRGRAAGDEAHVRIRLADLGTDELRRPRTVPVRAVAHGLLEVRAHERVQDARMRALAVIIA